MDLNANQKLIEGQNDSIGEAKDRISELPDSILHYILSFIKTKFVARTSLLSKRWNHIWSSIPTLVFPYWSYSEPPSLSGINNFMDFVDRTLILRDASSNFQKVYLQTHKHMNASRVHSWISYITKHNVKQLDLGLRLEEPFFLPSSLFKCESLTKLELTASCAIHIPKSFSFPNLKSLELRCIQFTDDCWNGQHFSNCPVLENLILGSCTWFGVRKFCILTPALKVLTIENDNFKEDGLRDCDLKIYAPNLVSLIYMDAVAKDYDMSSFVKLDKAEIYFNKYGGDETIGHGAAVRKFLQAISHVNSLMTGALDVETVLVADDFVNVMPTFHNLNILDLILGPATDELIFALLKAAPNLKKLRFDLDVFAPEDDHNGDADRVFDETEGLFQHLQSVKFRGVVGEGRELQWAKFILKNAKSLQKMTFGTGYCDVKEKELGSSELQNLPRASVGCVLKFV